MASGDLCHPGHLQPPAFSGRRSSLHPFSPLRPQGLKTERCSEGRLRQAHLAAGCRKESWPGSEEAGSDPPPAAVAGVPWEVSGHAASGDHPGGEWFGPRGV